jgi:AraC-like DNA-binding protein
MRTGATFVATLQLDQAEQDRLNDALRAHLEVNHCRTVDQLLRLIDQPSLRCVVVSIRESPDPSLEATLARAVLARPDIRVIAWCCVASVPCRGLLRLGWIGITEVAFVGVDDSVEAWQNRFVEPAGGPGIVELHTRLARTGHSFARHLILQCLEADPTRLSVKRLAATHGISRRTIVSRLHSEGFPSPSSVIRLCRLAHAIDLFRNGETSWRQIARRVGYQSSRRLDRALEQGIGKSLPELSRSTSFDALECIRERLTGSFGLFEDPPCR